MIRENGPQFNSKSTRAIIAHVENDLLEDVVQRIEESDFSPTVIVALSRGGLVPGVMLSHMLEIPLVPLIVSTRDFVKEEDLMVSFATETLRTHLSTSDRILIVDDIIDSGVSMTMVIEMLEDTFGKQVAQRIRTAALYERYGAACEGDFVGLNVETDQWLYFSWEQPA